MSAFYSFWISNSAVSPYPDQTAAQSLHGVEKGNVGRQWPLSGVSFHLRPKPDQCGPVSAIPVSRPESVPCASTAL